MRRIVVLAAVLFNSVVALAGDADRVVVLRTPNHGIQPQVAVDAAGGVHLIYFAGEAKGGDLFYVTAKANETTFSAPLRVNSQPGSAVAIGNIRGAHLALGRNGRAYAAWMGSNSATPKAPGNETPMLYARLNDAGDAFEPQRNVIQKHPGMDGGGSLAADNAGNIYVVWHGFDDGPRKEANRRVWVVKSSDDGRTFGEEIAASPAGLGCCACCGLKASADAAGRLQILFRSAEEQVHRDMWLAWSDDGARSFATKKIDRWEVDHCVMSNAALLPLAADRKTADQKTLAAWETKEQVFYAALDNDGVVSQPIAAPGAAARRKHPALASNAAGETLLAWTENMGWEKGGAAAWQVFDRDGKPIDGARGQVAGVPTWSLVAALAQPDGRFVIVY